MTSAEEDHRDGGFSMVEVVVAMMLLALIAVALLPALVSGMQLSIGQAQKGAAIRIANSVIEDVRADPSCDAIYALDKTTESDGRGGELTISASAPGCATNPAAELTVTVSNSDEVLYTAHAIVYVP